MPFKFSKKAKAMGFRKPVGAKAVKKIVRAEVARASEKKFINHDQAATVASSDGQVVLLSGLAQGVTAYTRTGRKIKVSSLSMKYQWDILNASDALTSIPTVPRPKFVRCIVFIDKLGDGTAPTPANVLEVKSIAGICTQHLESTQIDRWRILHDKVYAINPGLDGTVTGGGVLMQPFDYQAGDIAQRYNKFYKKFKNLPISYQADTAAQADVLKNAVYCLFMSDQPVAATATDDARARILWSARFRFTDD